MDNPEIGLIYTRRETSNGVVSFVLCVDGTWSDNLHDGRAACIFGVHHAYEFLESCRVSMSDESYRNAYYSTKGV